MLLRSLWLAAIVSTGVLGKASTDTTSGSESFQFTTLTSTTLPVSTGSYLSYSTQVSVTRASGVEFPSGSTSSSETGSTITQGSTSTITLLVGGVGVETLSVINGTTTLYPNTTLSTSTTSSVSSSTSSSAQPTNTQPCNGWAEFCDRSYGNITQVAAHNAAFAVKGNAASNQRYGITAQLNDGVRMLTSETQWVNNTMYNCHTSCDLLNAGTFQKNLQEVATWVKANPYDVVTILIANSDLVPVENYVDSIQNSGLGPYLYEPPLIPMRLKDWPTLSSFILSQKRVVIFMDYNANQTAVPYILDQYSQMWETAFSPQNISFPCTLGRPPALSDAEATNDYMYLANHNLNQAVSFAGQSFLIPNTAFINTTNAAGYDTGMLGLMARNCQDEWSGRPPNWLVVDYYDVNKGSVFEVAARMNNVTWNKSCCGVEQSAATTARVTASLMAIALFISVSGLYI